jgi:predicted permease
MYHPERLWGVAFAAVTIGFVIDTYLVIKGIRGKRMGIYDVLVSLGVPCLILLMLTDEKLTTGAKIIDSIIGFVCLVSGIVHIYVLRRKIPPNKKKE